MKIAGVVIPSSVAKEKCYFGMRELIDGERKGLFGFLAVDTIQRTNGINKCIYIGITKLFGISKPFSHFLTSEQSKYINSIGLDAFSYSVLFDAEKSFEYTNRKTD
ncbi:MAG: hypothetical protein GY761_11055 [Hyphomicrobiales bacterium]|nr:hypothetical protein [Hyphomicrobiales bacterium]